MINHASFLGHFGIWSDHPSIKTLGGDLISYFLIQVWLKFSDGKGTLVHYVCWNYITLATLYTVLHALLKINIYMVMVITPFFFQNVYKLDQTVSVQWYSTTPPQILHTFFHIHMCLDKTLQKQNQFHTTAHILISVNNQKQTPATPCVQFAKVCNVLVSKVKTKFN